MPGAPSASSAATRLHHVTDSDYRRERLQNGWIDLHRGEEGVWRISWAPDEGHPDFPGRTYSPGDPDLPDDYPGPDDVEALIAWGRQRWGSV
jgi:hypothetical protein